MAAPVVWYRAAGRESEGGRPPSDAAAVGDGGGAAPVAVPAVVRLAAPVGEMAGWSGFPEHPTRLTVSAAATAARHRETGMATQGAYARPAAARNPALFGS